MVFCPWMECIVYACIVVVIIGISGLFQLHILAIGHKIHISHNSHKQRPPMPFSNIKPRGQENCTYAMWKRKLHVHLSPPVMNLSENATTALCQPAEGKLRQADAETLILSCMRFQRKCPGLLSYSLRHFVHRNLAHSQDTLLCQGEGLSDWLMWTLIRVTQSVFDTFCCFRLFTGITNTMKMQRICIKLIALKFSNFYKNNMICIWNQLS